MLPAGRRVDEDLQLCRFCKSKRSHRLRGRAQIRLSVGGVLLVLLDFPSRSAICAPRFAKSAMNRSMYSISRPQGRA